MDFKRLVKSFKFATKGTITVIREEQNIKIYLFFGLINIILGIISKLTYVEWAVIVVTVGLCLAIEIINISLEELLDMISPEYNGRTKTIKDVSAGAALVSALVAIGVAAFIYLPHWL